MKKGGVKVSFNRGSCILNSDYNIHFGLKSKRSQVTIFIIVAILIAGSIGAYFILKNVSTSSAPKNMQPVYDYYLSCLQDNAKQGISILGEQGGYIKSPEFIPGSQYMPFSSQLDFFGQPVPYWLYISGNNILKEQVPTKSSMETELGNYVRERLKYCDFSDFEKQGYDIFIEDGNVNAKINDLSVDISSSNSITIYFENQSTIINNHKVSVKSKLGKFYGLALSVYDFEKKNMFLENYAIDVMRLYAPVNGVELTCSPKVFNENDIKTNLTQALSSNTGMIKLAGNYYTLQNPDNKYFVTNIGKNIDESVNFVYSPNFPSRIEIYGDKIAMPVGLQEGLGILGFCYVPYNLVYDIDFPVLIQFYDASEVFQFPIATIIDKNQARNALPFTIEQSIESEICKYKNKFIQVKTSDSNGDAVLSDIKFKCLDTECYIGKTSMKGQDAILEDYFPACVNGYVIAKADGFADAKSRISTNEEIFADVALNKLYELPIELNSNEENILISFDSLDYSTNVLYSDLKNVKLIEGYYNISVYIYKNSSIKLPSSSTRKCVSVPTSGIKGIFGGSEEKCFDINTPEQEISFAVIGGGKASEYITEDMLRNSDKLNIDAKIFKTPISLEEVQNNFEDVDNSKIEINFSSEKQWSTTP
ncbi:MAG: hypothetical protein Q7S33_03290 [Nanoarchaeota archaeon]|nr:hypothetical protein [Nanoarchaeota archaeon]